MLTNEIFVNMDRNHNQHVSKKELAVGHRTDYKKRAQDVPGGLSR